MVSNPLALDAPNRAFYTALLELHNCDPEDDRWLVLYRKVKTIKQVEGKAVFVGWQCFYSKFGDKELMPLLEKVCWGIRNE